MTIQPGGKYQVILTYGSDNREVSEFTLKLGQQTLAGSAKYTGGWGDHETIDLVTIELPAGAITVEM